MTRRPRFTRLNLERLEDRNAASDTLGVLLAGINPSADGDAPAPPPAIWAVDPAASARVATPSSESVTPKVEPQATVGIDSPLTDMTALRDPFHELPADGESTPEAAESSEFIAPMPQADRPNASNADAPAGPTASVVQSTNATVGVGDSSAPIDPSEYLPTFDADADGVSAMSESQAANRGDGNRDGVADMLQADVASLRAAKGAAVVTVEAAGHQLRNVRAVAPTAALNDQHALPLGLFAFEVHGVERGGFAAVKLFLPEGHNTDTYIKRDANGQFARFDFNGTTGATFHGNVVTLHLQDGGRGDADGVANGVIRDPGGPGDPIVMGAQVRSVEFSGADRIVIEADPGTPSYPTGPQWLDTNDNGVIHASTDRALPIAYPRDKAWTITAKFKPYFSGMPYTPPDYSLKAKASLATGFPNAHAFSMPWTPVTLNAAGTELTMAPVTLANPFPTYMNYGTLSLTWSFSVNGGQSGIPAGSTGNELYVTLAAPTINPVYHSFLHLVVPNAAAMGIGGGASYGLEAALIAAAWLSFSGQQLKNKAGVNLHYYKEWNTPSQTAATLLASLDGQCAAIGEAFVNSAKSAGVANTEMLAVQVAAKENEGMLIKNWTFAETGTANVPLGTRTYTHQNKLSDPTFNPDQAPGGVGSFTRKNGQTQIWEYYWDPATVEVVDNAGVGGQNTVNPKGHFSDHWIVRINGEYYDPSYGKKFGSLQA